MASVEAVIEDYRAAARRNDGTPLELEVRFDTDDFPFTETVVGEMLALVGEGCFTVAHSRTLNVIRPVAPAGDHRARNREHGQKSQCYIWERRFLDRVRREESYTIKTRVGLPAKVRSTPQSAGYKVVFSTEMPASKFALETLFYRLKNRLSFEPAAGAPPCELASALEGWRLDVTVARELADANATSLKSVASALFGLDPDAPEQTPATLFAQLGLTGRGVPTATLLANRRQYRYNVELEYVGDPEKLTAAGLERAVAGILHLSNPTYLLEAQAQSTVREAAAHVYRSPALLQKFASGAWGLKQLGPPAVAPTRGQYAAMYPPVGYYVTDKAHGIRALARVAGGRLALVAPGLEGLHEECLAYEEFCLEGVGKPTVETARTVPAGAGAERTAPPTILEGELVPDAAQTAELGGRPFPFQFLVYDCIVAYGTELADKPFEERVQALADATGAVASFGLACAVKPFVQLADSNPRVLCQQFEAMYTAKGREPPRRYEIDGLVLYAPGEPYASTPVYKWKPLEETTNDFLARRPPAAALGRPPFVERPGYELYFLFVGISIEQFQRMGMTYCAGYEVLFGTPGREPGAYFPIQFQPSDQPYGYLYYHPAGGELVENRIIELRLADAEGADGFDLPVLSETGKPTGKTVPTVAPHWELVRVRADRQDDLLKGRMFGNNFMTAERNWLNYRDPLTLEMLGAGPGPSYFATTKAGVYKAMTSFISYCKSALVRAHLGGLGWVVDLGAGKGQDMFRYREAQVRAAVMVDESRPALAELVRRKHEARPGQRGERAERATHIHVVKASFTEPHEAFVRRIRAIPQFPTEGADAVVCNLAAHYAFGSAESMANFVLILRGLVRPGGQVILTLMDGSRVQDLLNEHSVGPGGQWTAREGDALKYAIERRFREEKLTPAGQRIGVLLPFSDGQLYEEYLSNVGELNKVMTRRGFSLGQYEWLWDRHEEGFRSQKQNYAALTPADRTWLRLFAYVRYVRKEE